MKKQLPVVADEMLFTIELPAVAAAEAAEAKVQQDIAVQQELSKTIWLNS